MSFPASSKKCESHRTTAKGYRQSRQAIHPLVRRISLRLCMTEFQDLLYLGRYVQQPKPRCSRARRLFLLTSKYNDRRKLRKPLARPSALQSIDPPGGLETTVIFSTRRKQYDTLRQRSEDELPTVDDVPIPFHISVR